MLPGISCKDLRICIHEVLQPLKLWSLAAENLLLGTAAQESHMGQHLVQMGGGPAVSIYQIEPRTYENIVLNSDTYRRIGVKYGIKLPENVDMLIYDINAATLAARLFYTMIKERLPDANDLIGLAKYWKKYYNTPYGKGAEEEFIENYGRLVIC